MGTTTLYFTISYHTQWGEDIRILTHRDTIRLNTNDGLHWCGQYDIDTETTLEYRYAVFANDVCIREEVAEMPHIAYSGNSCKELTLQDSWIENRWAGTILRCSAFTDCIFHTEPSKITKRFLRQMQMEIHAFPPSGKNLTYALIGSSKDLGAWQEIRALPMHLQDNFRWTAKIKVESNESFDYKYVLWNSSTRQIVQWETGANHHFDTRTVTSESHIRKDDGTPLFNLPDWKGAGIVLPLFSLRSRKSCGIGDFGDLRLLIDWAASVGMSCVQLLPINDTTRTHSWRDSYPYNSVSVLALHPIYMDCNDLNIALTEEEERERSLLNDKPVVDYEKAEQFKLRLIRKYYQEKGKRLLQSTEYKKFYAQHQEWLLPYAAFCYLRDKHHTADFREWPTLRKFSEKGISQLLTQENAKREVLFYCCVQFLLAQQMHKVHEYARKKGVIIKGDIPIGISRDSVPAWVDGDLFNFNGQAGAPPDAFATQGQNWGFPTYQWERMKSDGYSWWKRRLRIMADYFDAYRIDHVLGFFRIWEIPYGRKDGLLGHFVPALPFHLNEIEERGLKMDEQTIFSASQNIDKDVKKVLFIEDNEQPQCYHPCIVGRQSKAYSALSSSEQSVYDGLFDEYFYHRNNDFWGEKALEKLPILINASAMLPCAEDLGMVPSSVKSVLEKLQILSLEIERMPKEYGVEFGDVCNYPYLSVATIATHDMPPLRLWWQQNPQSAQRYYENVLNRTGQAPTSLSGELCEQIIQRHLQSPSMLCLLAFQDWISIDERLRMPSPEAEQINHPEAPDQYWQYRMHLSIEDLITNSFLNEKIRGLIQTNGR